MGQRRVIEMRDKRMQRPEEDDDRASASTASTQRRLVVNEVMKLLQAGAKNSPHPFSADPESHCSTKVDSRPFDSRSIK